MKSQILHGAYVATFYRSNDVPPIYHSVITKQESPEIVSWCQCRTSEECERNATDRLNALNGLVNRNLLLFPPMTKTQLLRLGAGKKKSHKQKRKIG
jgi:hypothetical protein